MKITKEFLHEHSACADGLKFVTKNNLIDLEDIDFINKLIEHDKLDWANWLIVRVMERKQCLAYAIFAAEQVLSIFEKKYPDDLRPRKAIEAAKKVLESDTQENRDVAYAAYAYAAAYAADAAADAAAYADDAAADAAYAADAAAYAQMKIKILQYGISLLKEKEKCVNVG